MRVEKTPDSDVKRSEQAWRNLSQARSEKHKEKIQGSPDSNSVSLISLGTPKPAAQEIESLTALARPENLFPSDPNKLTRTSVIGAPSQRLESMA
jgi:hypothetical protein